MARIKKMPQMKASLDKNKSQRIQGGVRSLRFDPDNYRDEVNVCKIKSVFDVRSFKGSLNYSQRDILDINF